MPIERVGIIGLGLIGGSLAKSFRKRGGITYIAAYGRNEETLRTAQQEGIITQYATALDDTFAGLDAVFVCTPVDYIVSHAQALALIIGPDCILTDAGSVKSQVFQEIAAINGLCFIGGHPMAGSEQTGYEASTDYLFENAYYVLTPAPNASVHKMAELRTLLTCIGAIPIVMSPERHDRAVAAISHAPHVIAAALVNAVRTLEDPTNTLLMLAAGGFKDITRIASSNPDLWQSISMENAVEIAAVLDVFGEQIKQFREALAFNDSESLRRFYANAKDYRDRFQNRTSYIKTYELYIDVRDQPGVIATVAAHMSSNGINIKNIGVVNNREFDNGVLQIIVDSEADREKCSTLLKKLNFPVYER